ncbi:flagellar basal body rod protein FlgC [Enterococcus italicus]|uniref:flagellar basal body rod protein FlgC n=1 Tax=Enterococcus italicus TaxID=246144 RepID=UPI0028A59106|nr:flagellar basal body rod protein FlgC [Enterococcus italicus]
MSIFNGLNINASGLALERFKLDTISTNIANVNTTKTAEGGPYKQKTVTFAENLRQSIGKNRLERSYGVRTTGIVENQEVKMSYDPENPDADENGYVEQSNVNMADEMVAMLQAVRTYEANVSSAESNKTILKKALEISKN